MNRNLEVNEVLNALKTSYSLREAVRQLYGEFQKKYEAELYRFLKKNEISAKEYLLKQEEKHYYCKQCGKEILGKERTRKQFCNSSCAAKYNNKGREVSLETRLKTSQTLLKHYYGDSFDNREIRNPKKVTKKRECKSNLESNKKYYCLNCGKRLNRPNQYCNNKCQFEYRYKQYIEAWKKGEETGVISQYDMSAHVRRYMLEKANYQCTRCGWHEKNPHTGRVPLQIHHKDGNCLNNTEENLEVLCPNCHSLTDNYGSRNKNATKGRTKYYTSQYRKLRYNNPKAEEDDNEENQPLLGTY